MKHLEEKAEEKPVIDLDTKMGHLGLGLFTGIITGIALTLSSHFVYNNYFQKPAVNRAIRGACGECHTYHTEPLDDKLGSLVKNLFEK